MTVNPELKNEDFKFFSFDFILLPILGLIFMIVMNMSVLSLLKTIRKDDKIPPLLQGY